MNIQFSDITNLIQILIWPIIIVSFVIFYRREIKKAIKKIIPRIGKLSIANLVTVELREFSGLSLGGDTFVQDLASRSVTSSNLPHILSQLQKKIASDCAIIDLGKGKEWLTSRLFLLAFLLKNLLNLKCLVFVCDKGNKKKVYVGNALSDQVQDAIARSFPMYISTMEKVLHKHKTSIYNTRIEVQHLREDTEKLSEAAIDFIEELKTKNKLDKPDLTLVETVDRYEHACWIDKPILKKILGSELNTSYVTKEADTTKEEYAKKILKSKGKFVAVVNSNHVYQSLVDRGSILEQISKKLGYST